MDVLPNSFKLQSIVSRQWPRARLSRTPRASRSLAGHGPTQGCSSTSGLQPCHRHAAIWKLCTSHSCHSTSLLSLLQKDVYSYEGEKKYSHSILQKTWNTQGTNAQSHGSPRQTRGNHRPARLPRSCRVGQFLWLVQGPAEHKLSKVSTGWQENFQEHIPFFFLLFF